MNKSFQFEVIFLEPHGADNIDLFISIAGVTSGVSLHLCHPDKLNLVGKDKLKHDFIKLIQRAYEINAKHDVLRISYGT